MKYLGIDYGAKRIGLAISDGTSGLAFPLKVVENKSSLVNDISLICNDEEVDEIIVGESLNFAQKENEIMKEITPFVESLKEKIGLPVHMHPEFLTSQEADRLQGRNVMRDASAAALILMHYLETKK